jgi:hypothetical protein
MRRRFAAAPIVVLASVQFAWAQPHDHHRAHRPATDPADARIAVPPVRYESSLRGYRRADSEPVGNWRDANDTVGRIGGWRAYAREASEAGAPTGGAPPSGAAPKSAPRHGGHGGHDAK